MEPWPVTNWPHCGKAPPAKAAGAKAIPVSGKPITSQSRPTRRAAPPAVIVVRTNPEVLIIRHTNRDDIYTSFTGLRESRGAAYRHT